MYIKYMVWCSTRDISKTIANIGVDDVPRVCDSHDDVWRARRPLYMIVGCLCAFRPNGVFVGRGRVWKRRMRKNIIHYAALIGCREKSSLKVSGESVYSVA